MWQGPCRPPGRELARATREEFSSAWISTRKASCMAWGLEGADPTVLGVQDCWADPTVLGGSYCVGQILLRCVRRILLCATSRT